MLPEKFLCENIRFNILGFDCFTPVLEDSLIYNDLFICWDKSMKHMVLPMFRESFS